MTVPFEIVAEERKRRIGEEGRVGFTLIDEELEFFEFVRVHSVYLGLESILEFAVVPFLLLLLMSNECVRSPV